MADEVRLIRSPVSVTGMVLTTISAVVFLVVFLADLFGMHTNPYMGILFFLVLPSIFLFGLFLIPLGAWIERRRRERGLAPNSMHWPRIDLNDPTQRRTAIAVFALSIANIVIVSLAAYRGIEYMDSVQFCGQVCHAAMNPEYQAYQRGVKLIGATSHYVTADLDEGPIIEQDVARISHADTADDLVAIGRDTESRVLARAVKSHLERRVLLSGHRTVVFGK